MCNNKEIFDFSCGCCDIFINNNEGGKVIINCCDADDPRFKNYKLTIHEFILLEYNRRLDRIRISENLMTNKDEWMYNEIFKEYEFSEFYVNNIELFTDIDLFHEVLEEAREKYGVEQGAPLWSPYDPEILEMLGDYDGSHDGINLIRLGRQERLNDLRDWIERNANSEWGNYTEYEHVHFQQLWNMIRNDRRFRELIQFVEWTKDDVELSPEYKSILDFAINTFKFYNAAILPSQLTRLPETAGADIIASFNGDWPQWRWRVIISDFYQNALWCKNLFIWEVRDPEFDLKPNKLQGER